MGGTTFSHTRRAVGVLLLVGAALALAGCKGKPTGSVSGKVTYKGQPLTTGEVQFYAPEKGAGAGGKLDGSGNYTLQGAIDVGTYKVYVQPPVPEQLPPGTPPPKAAPFNIPPKYQTPQSTPLTKEVKAGNNDIPIDITD